MVKNIKGSLTAVLFYFFRQVIYYLDAAQGYFLVGNFDAFYILAPVYIAKKIRKIPKNMVMFIVVCIAYLLIQIMLIPELNVLRASINVAKIVACYIVMQYIKEYHNKIDFKFICKMFSLLCVVFLIISLIMPNGILWRHNDTINKYDLNRLQFLYTEPSELGFHAILILLLYIYMLSETREQKRIFINFLYIIPIILALFLAKPFGAIAIGGLAIIAFGIMDLIYHYSKRKLEIYFALLIIAIIIGGYMIFSQNPLYLRMIDTLNGKDQSNMYRLRIPFNVSRQIIFDTKGLGIGFGNLELENNVNQYRHLGLEKAGIVNSYMNVISEGGIFGIILVLVIIIQLLRKSFQDKSTIKIALSVFIIIYQFMGAHFTNPLCWIIYGIILSDIKFDETLKNYGNKEKIIN